MSLKKLMFPNLFDSIPHFLSPDMQIVAPGLIQKVPNFPMLILINMQMINANPIIGMLNTHNNIPMRREPSGNATIYVHIGAKAM